MKPLATPPKLQTLRSATKKPTGPRFLPKLGEQVNGPGLVPAGFISGKNSATEWNAYWALAKIFNNPKDPRKPPFVGGWPDWTYQSQYSTLFGLSSSTNIDFVIYQGGTTLAVRIQTERYHVFVDATKHAYDEMQRMAIERRGLRVVDIFEPQLLHDPSGANYVIAMKMAIGRLEQINPVHAAVGLRGSKQKVIR